MADEIDPRKQDEEQNEEMGKASDENIAGSVNDEEFEEMEEDDTESEADAKDLES